MKRRTWLLVLAGSLLPVLATAQASPGSAPLDAETPRAMVLAFFAAARSNDFQEASRYLDWSGLPIRMGEWGGAALARELKAILDRHGELDPNEFSAAPEGDQQDGLPLDEDRLAAILTDQGEVELFIERKSLPEGQNWLVSPRSVDRIPILYAEPRYGFWGRLFPEFYFKTHALGLALWQWLGLLIGIPLAYAVGLVVTWLASRIARIVVRRTRARWDDALVERASGPFRLAMAVTAFVAALGLLSLPVALQVAIGAVAKALFVYAVAWFVLRALDLLALLVQESPTGRDEAVVNTLLPMLRRIAIVFVLALTAVALLQSFGFNVSSLLAGLGLGGLVVALAAQKTVENFFGGLSVIADRPAKVGDVCRVGEYQGTIEDIGLRSTRIRTPDRTVVTLPNSQFSTLPIENFSLRDRFRLQTVLAIAYDASPDQVRYLLVELKRMLAAHPRTLPDPCRVRFVGLGASALEIEVFVYIGTTDPEEFLAIREDLFLRMMDIVKASGASFAFPSQTVYMREDGGPDRDRTRKAEAAVKAWREAGELMLPDFPPEKLAELDDSLEYPPPGSAARRKSKTAP